MPESARAGGFWNRIGPADRAAFEKVAKKATYPAGTTLIRAGEDGEWAAVLTKGSVQVLSADEKLKIAVRRVDDIIGEQSPLDGSARSATVVAQTRVEALVIGRKDLEQLLQQCPQVLRVLCRVMSERLRESDQRLAGDRVLARVVQLIVKLADERGLPVGGDVQIRIRSQEELADTLGVARNSVGRALSILRSEGLVSTPRMRLVVHDLDALRERPVR